MILQHQEKFKSVCFIIFLLFDRQGNIRKWSSRLHLKGYPDTFIWLSTFRKVINVSITIFMRHQIQSRHILTLNSTLVNLLKPSYKTYFKHHKKFSVFHNLKTLSVFSKFQALLKKRERNFTLPAMFCQFLCTSASAFALK